MGGSFFSQNAFLIEYTVMLVCFPSGEVLMRWSAIEQVIMDTKMMCIFTSYVAGHLFHES